MAANIFKVSLFLYWSVYFLTVFTSAASVRLLYLLPFCMVLLGSIFFLLERQRMPRAFLYVVLLPALCGVSVFRAEDFNWAVSAYGSFIIRYSIIVPFVLSGPNIIDLKALKVLFYLNLVTYFLWVAGIFGLIGIETNAENFVGASLIALFPFILSKRLFPLSFAMVLLLFIAGSRIGAACALLTIILFYVVRFVMRGTFGKRSVLFLGGLISVAIVFVAGLDVFFPSDIPIQGDDDFKRALHNYFGLRMISENWLWGIGFGQFQKELLILTGYEVSPHGFLFYFWAQAGLLCFLAFLFVSYTSVRSGFKAYAKTQSVFHLAVSISCVVNFLFFVTRTQYDNIFYFMMLGIAISLLRKRNFEVQL